MSMAWLHLPFVCSMLWLAEIPGGVRPPSDPFFATVGYGLSLITEDDQQDLVSVEREELPRALRLTIENNFVLMMASNAVPMSAESFTIRAAAAKDDSANDLIEYTWIFDGVPLRALVSRNLVRIDTPLDAIASPTDGKESESWSKGLVIDWVGRLVRLEDVDTSGRPYKIEFSGPEVLRHGDSLSSKPGFSLHRMLNWYDRVDVTIRDGTLSILRYKKPGQLMQFQDGARWFPQDFREFLHQGSREQRKWPTVDGGKR